MLPYVVDSFNGKNGTETYLWWCKLVNYSGDAGYTLLVLALCLGSIDRYHATSRNARLRQRSSMKVATISVTIITLISLLLAIPDLLYCANKSSAEPVQQVKIEISSSQDDPSYPLQGQSPFELARENSHRDRENALQSLRKTITASGINSSVNASLSSSITISCEDSFNISRKESCNISHASSVSELTSISSVTPQIREQTQARVHSLVEEYTEKYPLFSDRPVKEGLQDLFAFYTPSHDQQAIIVRELFKNNLEAKPLARQGAGHLLNATLNGSIISTDAFISGFKMILEVAVDYAIDVPEIWQYFGEIIGAFIGGSTSNMSLIKPILQSVPEDISNELFQYIIHYATEFSSQSRIQGFWHASGISIKDVLKSDRIDPSFMEAYDWLFAKPENEPLTVQTKENFLPRADSQLVRLFKSINDQEIITYISEHMDPHEKFCIRNIVLSYLEACLDTHNSQKKIQEDIARERMTILNEIIEHDPEVELEAVYAIQNFVNKLGNPTKMALQLFHIFYDEECISEDTFYDWLDEPDPSDTEEMALQLFHIFYDEECISEDTFYDWLDEPDPSDTEDNLHRMDILPSRNRLIWFIFLILCFFLWFVSKTIVKNHFNSTQSPFSFIFPRHYTANLSSLWTELDYQLWKHEKYFPHNNPRGSIIYMIMTGNSFLRSRCDIIMCTIGITLHPSRLFFVGETSSDSRLPIYDVITSDTPRPINRAGSMQKLAQGLAMISEKINQSKYKNELQWIMVMDDDTFVSPPNLELLVSEYDSRRSLMIGQSTCGVGFCGGGGYVISKALFNQFPSFIRQCRPSFELSQSDQFIPQCIKSRTQVEIIDRKEFNSQPPEFYSTEAGYKDHPNGFGRAVSFHYIRPATKYIELWRLHQAFMRPN
ncbi:unnamed protein product [Adineta steineri]|uniref:N-acetylgalactosaminide beta-1,3-galactosyltransferase n=1 Tax=Adineta steineri TaxID=433720 RepID=A0A815NLZ2_9BILA|nr:unnamed protein product [Adineta steineri]